MTLNVASHHYLSVCVCSSLYLFITDFALILWYAEFLHSCIFDLSNVITCILNIPFTETGFVNEFVFLQFAISSSEKFLILVLGTNFLVNSAELSEPCMIGHHYSYSLLGILKCIWHYHQYHLRHLHHGT